MNRILIVDDDVIIRIALSKLLKKDGYNTKLVGTGKLAISALESFRPQLVLLDFELPDMNGFEILKRIKQIDKSIIVIMITSFADVRKAVEAMKMGAYNFFSKPFDKTEILSVVKKALSIPKKSESLPINISEMMGTSKPLQGVLKDIERVSDKDITVFLEGETGTGKELFARMIHQKSPRKDKPFIAVDCGAIPESLFESELFGHKKGAFTGATEDKKGKFELADGGTLFLDEINSLPMNMQPKFLRALQENEIQRLGDEHSKKINVRIIAASNNNINEDVRIGIFREDLFYRIHEFKIDLPNLKQRKDDIPIIAKYFLKEISADYKKIVTHFSPVAMKTLSGYSWPGNIRELKNVIKSAVLLCDEDKIEIEHLVLKNVRKLDEENKDDDLSNVLYSFTEKEMIEKALRKTKYNKTEAAKLLGISRSKFYHLLEKFNIS